ncbi:DUF362 domain-containing protein [Candidatus Woesearchaeota archaeon]|nr:DUF362 domain-containing protein [Candidatus Woesearchaeota archaeon]
MLFSQSEKEFIEKVKPELTKRFKSGEKIAVKLHMGEHGNKTYLKPEFVKQVISILIENGCMPFLFDSPAMYQGGRDTAKKYLKTAAENGFTEESISCPIIISEESKTVKTPHLKAEVCKQLTEADGMLVLTHVKGHMCSGVGGAVKNLGMGGVSKKTKTDIHHLSWPIIVGECIKCEACVKACPVATITVGKEKIEVDYDNCWGCNVCVYVCPQKALKPKVASFDALLAEGAFAVVSSVKKAYYINVLKEIAKLCDCMAQNGPIICDDVGYLASEDIVEIENESVDLINKKAGKNIFLEVHRKDPYGHIKEMERLLKK